MSKKIFQKAKEIYTFITEKNKEAVLRGENLLPICYAIIMEGRENISMLSIPLDKYPTTAEMLSVLSETGKILKERNARVKMFMYTTRANAAKGSVEKTKDCIIFSARDCYNNSNYQILEVIKGDKIKLKRIVGHSTKNWEEGKVKKAVNEDTLLDSIWSAYKNA